MVDGMLAPGMPVDAVAVDIGSVRVGFVGVGAAGVASNSIPGNESVLVGGTWGVPAPPSLVSATASNSGRGAGFNSGDTLALVRDWCNAKAQACTNEHGLLTERALVVFRAAGV